MAHTEDLWVADDGSHRPRHGTGKRYRVRWVTPEGRERSKSFSLKGAADSFRKVTDAALERPDSYTDPRAGKVTVRKFCEGWLASQTFGESTRETTEMRLRVHVLPALGDVALSALTPSRVQAWVKGLGVAPSYSRAILSLLSGILNAAVDDGLIVRNPCKAGSVRAPRAAERKIRPWTAERVSSVRAALPERYRAMADCGSGLGMRQGEVLGLAAGDIDFLRRVVHVRRQVKIVAGRLCFGPPKGGKEREIPLPDEVKWRLSAHIAAHPPVAVTLPLQAPGGRLETADLIFTTADRQPVNRHQWNDGHWKPALEAAGIPAGRDAGFHQLRHHFASSLLAGGVDIRALATYLGHGDPGFTLRVYVHLMPGTADKMRQAIDAALTSNGTAPAQKAVNA